MSYEAWLNIWVYSHEAGMSGPSLRAWPDGKSLLKQPALLVEVFSMITEQQIAQMKMVSAQSEARK